MRFVLAFAVTLSFLAGQACGNGVRAFRTPAAETAEELMSRLVVRCDAREQGIAAESADCGPGRCVQPARDEPDDASVAVNRADVSFPPPVRMEHRPAPFVALNRVTRSVPRPSRPMLEVRRE